MLVLSRKRSERIVIGSEIQITVVRLERNQVRLGIKAPQGLTILRGELVCGDNSPDVLKADHTDRPTRAQ